MADIPVDSKIKVVEIRKKKNLSLISFTD